ncbi:MAG: glycosyltransferase family 4 protein [Mycobacteriales bacterium]
MTAARHGREALRILHVTDSYLPTIGGIELHVSDLAGRQQRAGHVVDIVTRSASSTIDDCVVHAPHQQGAGPRPPTVERLARMLSADARYDVVHVHASVYSPLAWRATLLCARQRTPVVFTAHSLLTGATRPYRAASRLLRLRRLPVVWSAVSTAAARSLSRGMAFADGTVRVLPNAVDPATWRPDTVRGEPDVVTFVTVGRLAARKRPRALLRAFHDAGVSPAARLVVVGDGPRAAASRRWCRTHPHTAVTLLGPQNRQEIRKILHRADVFVAPATRESFGIAALEAHAAGLPVIARAGTGVADFVEDGVHGLLVDDDLAMSEGIRTLTFDRPLLRKLATRTQEDPSGYDWANATALTEAAYDDAAALTCLPR